MTNRHTGEDAWWPLLIGDIGGTHARFAVVGHDRGEMVRLADTFTADYASIDDAITAALASGEERPRAAMLALAGPITSDRVPLTNSGWVVEPKRLMGRLALNEVVLLNDFEAQALSLPGLGDNDIARIGGGSINPDATRVVVGPGTGLGAGALVRAAGLWIPVPGEGGHVDLGPRTERDFAIWPHIERPHGRVEAETVISGGGMLRLYRAVCATDGVAPRRATPEEVTHAALAGDDREAVEALTLFCTYLGRLAGDLALVFMARGGVYLAGGIPAKIAPLLQSGAFRDAFVAKPPHDRVLADIATAIIVREDAALSGVAAFARAPERFGMDVSGRRWRA